MNRKYLTLALLSILSLAAVSCSYNEEPSRTTDATTTYVTPKGELPSAEEREYVEQVIKEYNESIK